MENSYNNSCECKKCVLKALYVQQKQIKRLNERVTALEQVIRISNGGYITIGTEENPVDKIYADTIGSINQPVTIIHTTNSVTSSFNTKGICLDDTTSALTPSFDAFPRNWLTTSTSIGSVRTYHYGTGVDNSGWVKWLMSNGINVMIGITLEQYQTELDKLATDYANTDFKLLFDRYTLAIGVGNEASSSNIQAIKDGIAYAKDLRAQNKLPSVSITTVLKDDTDWFIPGTTYPPIDAQFTTDFLSLAPELDIFCFNMYDGLGVTDPNVPIDVKLSWTSPSVTLNGFGAVRFAMGKTGYIDKPFWCTEVGWTSAGSIPGSTVTNLETFYKNFLNFNTQMQFIPEASNGTLVVPPNRIFYFTIRDSNGESFGLYTSADILTPKFN